MTVLSKASSLGMDIDILSDKERMLREVRDAGIRAQGRKELVKYLKGGRLTRRETILANCYMCMGYYSDGTQDCCIHTCPLYPFMPYAGSDSQ